MNFPYNQRFSPASPCPGLSAPPDPMHRREFVSSEPPEVNPLTLELLRTEFPMTVNELMNHASGECIEERERYLIIFTHGANGYVCRNEGVTDESRALYHGTYHDCQIWI